MCSLEFAPSDLFGEQVLEVILRLILESLISSASHFSQVLNLPPGDLPLPSEKADLGLPLLPLL
jgi:hypothetical protein